MVSTKALYRLLEFDPDEPGTIEPDPYRVSFVLYI